MELLNTYIENLKGFPILIVVFLIVFDYFVLIILIKNDFTCLNAESKKNAKILVCVVCIVAV